MLKRFSFPFNTNELAYVNIDNHEKCFHEILDLQLDRKGLSVGDGRRFFLAVVCIHFVLSCVSKLHLVN